MQAVFLNALAPMVLHALGHMVFVLMESHGERVVPAHQVKWWREYGYSHGDAAWWGKRSNVLLAVHSDDNDIEVRFYIPGLVDLSTKRSMADLSYDFQWLADWLDQCWRVAVEATKSGRLVVERPSKVDDDE